MSIDAEASHRSALWLSMTLTLLGSCGACNGWNTYNAPPVPSTSVVTDDTRPGAAELAEVFVTLATAFADAPHRRPLALANVLCSGMLIAGGFMLGIRRQSARWFISNALVANVVWIAADAVTSVMQLNGWRVTLIRKLIPYVQAATPPGSTADASYDRVAAEASITMGATIIVLAGLVKVGMHLWVLRRTQSPMIGAFIDQPPEA
jgi:hypothetical protein